MAKDKTRVRKLPEWLNQRTSFAVRLWAAAQQYYQLGDLQACGWHDKYGDFRQGAKIK